MHKQERAILRAGIRARRHAPGVYAMPVVANYLVTHQWTRELLKWRRQPMVAVYFRLDDGTPVLVGRYGRPHVAVTAAQAAAMVGEAEDAMGWECILADDVPAHAITRTAPVRGVVGWRHFPKAHGVRPCGCPACVTRGEPGARAMSRAYALRMGDPL